MRKGKEEILHHVPVIYSKGIMVRTQEEILGDVVGTKIRLLSRTLNVVEDTIGVVTHILLRPYEDANVRQGKGNVGNV